MKFEGIMPALVTPLNEDETINIKVLGDLIEYQLAHGADGFYVGGATGEGLALKTEQRFILAEESVKAINGRKPCIFAGNVPCNKGTCRIQRHVAVEGLFPGNA